MKKPIPAEKKRLVYERDNKVCIHCKKEVLYKDAKFDYRDLTFKPGYNSIKNIIILCEYCYALRSSVAANRVHTAIAKGIVPPVWRGLVWEDSTLMK